MPQGRQAFGSEMRSGSGARGSRGSRSGRSSLGRNAFRDHASAGATATDTAAFDGTLATAALAAARLTGRSLFAASRSGFFAVATLVLRMHAGQKAAVATVVVTTVATMATVAAVASNGTRVTADEGDGDESKEHRNCKSEKTLHKKSPGKENRTRHAFLKPSRNKPDPGRLPDRSKRVDNLKNPGTIHFRQPAALPCKRCGLAKKSHLGNLGNKAILRPASVKNWRKTRCFGTKKAGGSAVGSSREAGEAVSRPIPMLRSRDRRQLEEHGSFRSLEVGASARPGAKKPRDATSAVPATDAACQHIPRQDKAVTGCGCDRLKPVLLSGSL